MGWLTWYTFVVTIGRQFADFFGVIFKEQCWNLYRGVRGSKPCIVRIKCQQFFKNQGELNVLLLPLKKDIVCFCLLVWLKMQRDTLIIITYQNLKFSLLFFSFRTKRGKSHRLSQAGQVKLWKWIVRVEAKVMVQYHFVDRCPKLERWVAFLVIFWL